MRKYKVQFFAFATALICLSCSGVIAGETFKSSEFLKYSKSSQDSYITIAAGMAGVVAARNNPVQAGCVDQWVSEQRKGGYQPVIRAMRQYPDYHPHAVILAVLQKACGSFKYVNP